MSQHCSEDTAKNESKIPMFIWVLMTIVTIIVIGVSAIYVHHGKQLNYLEALIAWFTALAFTGMIGTLFLQRDELKQTRDVLKDTAAANKKSAEIALKHMELSKIITKIETELQKIEFKRRIGSGPAASKDELQLINDLLAKMEEITLPKEGQS